MSRTTIALVRHGRTDWNRLGLLQGSSDRPLDDVGRAQAAGAAVALGTESWDAVVTSPLRRAHGSAEIIATALALAPPTVHGGLVERTYGEAEGLTREDASRRWPSGEYPGLEPLDALADRGAAAVEGLADDHDGAALVAVAHGALIRATAEKLLGTPVPRLLNGSVTILCRSHGRWSAHAVNRLPEIADGDDRGAAAPVTSATSGTSGRT